MIIEINTRDYEIERHFKIKPEKYEALIIKLINSLNIKLKKKADEKKIN